MDITLILGPMKSGKSLDLISFFAPLAYTNLKFSLYQSRRNVRDEFIQSRDGVKLVAKKVDSLFEIMADGPQDVVGIDEIHMFKAEDVAAVDELLKKGTQLIISGLDTDYQGRLFDTVARLFELGPKEIRYRRAVCEICRHPSAVYTQIVKNGQPVVAGLPPVVPDDGTYQYQVVCRKCFVKS